MVDERKLNELATAVLDTCEVWDRTPGLKEISYKKMLAIDLGLFVLTFSGNARDSLKKMTWFPNVKFEEDTVKQIFERLSDSGKLWLAFGFEVPILLQTTRLQWTMTNECNREVLSDTMEGFYEFFELLGAWLLEQSDENCDERRKKLEDALNLMRNYIDEKR